MDLAEKYRPKNFSEVFNQDKTVNSLRSVLSRDPKDIPHAFLFTGPAGCGKTTLAYILKDKFRCGDFNFEYLNTSNTRGIDTIREIDTRCRFKPPTREGEAAVRIYVLDECHELTKNAQDALLALLERPPSHVYFILCTTDPEKLLETIRSRCHTYAVQRFSRPKLITLLRSVCESEGVSLPTPIFKAVATASEGSARKCLKVLDSIIDLGTEEEMLEAIQDNSVDHREIIDICRIMLNKQYTNWPDLCRMLKGIDAEPEKIRRNILSYLSAVALNSKQYDIKLIAMMTIFAEPVMYSGMGGLVAQIGQAFEI